MSLLSGSYVTQHPSKFAYSMKKKKKKTCSNFVIEYQKALLGLVAQSMVCANHWSKPRHFYGS